MALRFQNKGDDVDREVEESKPGLGCFFLVAVLFGAFWFAWDVFISGKSINWAYRDMSWAAVFICVVFISERRVIPKYREFRIRTKEIYGTVTEIEKTISAAKEDQKELLERLSAIEGKLDSVKIHLNGPDFDLRPTERGHFPELTGIQSGLLHLDKAEREIRDREKLDRIREKDRP